MVSNQRGNSGTTSTSERKSRSIKKRDYIPAKDAITIVKKYLKHKCKTLSIKMGRGTGYGWIEIRGSGEYGNFTDEEKQFLKQIGLSYGSNMTLISPEDREFWVKKFEELTKKELISSPQDVKRRTTIKLHSYLVKMFPSVIKDIFYIAWNKIILKDKEKIFAEITTTLGENVYTVTFFDEKGNKLFSEKFREKKIRDTFFKIAEYIRIRMKERKAEPVQEMLISKTLSFQEWKEKVENQLYEIIKIENPDERLHKLFDLEEGSKQYAEKDWAISETMNKIITQKKSAERKVVEQLIKKRFSIASEMKVPVLTEIKKVIDKYGSKSAYLPKLPFEEDVITFYVDANRDIKIIEEEIKKIAKIYKIKRLMGGDYFIEIEPFHYYEMKKEEPITSMERFMDGNE